MRESRSSTWTIVAVAALVCALAAGVVIPSDSIDQPPPATYKAPALVASGQGDWLWVVWMGTGGQAGQESGKDEPPTRIAARQLLKDWQRLRDLNLSELRALAADGDELHVFLRDGQHLAYAADGGTNFRGMIPDKGYTPIAACVAASGEGNRLHVLTAGATSQPDTLAATTQPAAAPLVGDGGDKPGPQSQPADAPANPYRPLRLYTSWHGKWKTPDDLPLFVTQATRVRLAVYRGQPVCFFLLRGERTTLHAIQLTESGWHGLGEAAGTPPGQLPPPIADADRKMPALSDLLVATINNQLFLLGWPEQEGVPLRLAQVTEDSRLTQVEELDLQPAPGSDFARNRQWDVTADDQRLIFVRMEQEKGKETVLQTRRYDPVNRKFEANWEDISALKPATGLLPILESKYVYWIALAVLAGLFLLRRPEGLIRIPGDARVAGLLPRLLAFMIDSIPASLIAFYYVYGGRFDQLPRTFGEMTSDKVATDPKMQLAYFWSLVALAAYQSICEILFASTPGKKLFRLQVRNTRAEKPAVWQVFVRNAIKIVELPTLVPLVVVFLDPGRRRLGDMVAGTIVVAPRPGGQSWIYPPGSQGPPPPPPQARPPGDEGPQDVDDPPAQKGPPPLPPDRQDE
ncbi:MAG: hypothetical protein BIFFINMI_01699 [Phycisphaerae bacterium]|nr:hypothetical protein [Phycisphaerae bacterium]